MNAWPDPEFALLDQYLGQRKPYLKHQRPLASVLRRFQCDVMSSAPGQPLCLQKIIEWLKAMVLAASVAQAIRRAQSVTHFLDWLTDQGSLPANPLRELRQECRRESTAAIVRALVSENAQGALKALRGLPAYGSHLGPAIRSHVERMQQLGFRYKEDRFVRFDRFLQQREGASECPVRVLVREYAESARTAAGHLERLKVGRAILDSLRRLGACVEMQQRDSMIVAAMYRERRKPYIFTPEEIQRLFKTAQSFPSPKAPLRPLTLYTMVVLAYCAGLRMCELIHLLVGDIRLDEYLIEIRGTKFFKSRRLPLSSSVAEALRTYLHARTLAGANKAADSTLFWHHKKGYAYITANHLLRRVLRKAGLKPTPGRTGPRIHDLRHTFVVHRMLAWYREGVNAQAKLPFLWTYLGHQDLHSTIVYLTVTQELLQQASERFRKFGAGLLQRKGERE